MVKALIVFLSLFICGLIHAVIQEPYLNQYCQRTVLDVAGGWPAEERIKKEKNICTQKFPYPLKGNNAIELCRYFAPFVVAEHTENADSVTCKWKSQNTCPGTNMVLIKGKCFYLGNPARYFKANGRCVDGGKLHRVVDQDEARWISLLLHSEHPVYVANQKNNTSSEMRVKDLVWDGEGFRNDKSDVPSLALLMRMNNLHEEYAGKIVKVDKDVVLRVACSVPSVNYEGSGASRTEYISMPAHMAPGANKIVMTSSVYQPAVSSSKNIDTKYFHDVCKNIYKNCFAALPGMTSELSSADDISYVPARYVGKNVKQKNQCKKHQFRKVLRKLFQTQPGSSAAGDIDKSSWQSKYPDDMCADTPRTAVVSQKNGKIKDSPANTRHRLTCVMGDEPGVKPFSLCRSNSEADGQGGCRCKPGFIDIRNTTLTQAAWFDVGQVCVTKEPCGSVRGIVVDFVLDLGLSHYYWPDLLVFAGAAPGTLPRDSIFYYTTFTCDVKTYEGRVFYAGPALTPIYDADACIGKALVEVATVLKDRKEDMKLAILVTDGAITDDIRPGLKKLKEAGVRLLVLPIGSTDQARKAMKTWVDREEDVLSFRLLRVRNTLKHVREEYVAGAMRTACDKPGWDAFKQAVNNM